MRWKFWKKPKPQPKPTGTVLTVRGGTVDIGSGSTFQTVNVEGGYLILPRSTELTTIRYTTIASDPA